MACGRSRTVQTHKTCSICFATKRMAVCLSWVVGWRKLHRICPRESKHGLWGSSERKVELELELRPSAQTPAYTRTVSLGFWGSAAAQCRLRMSSQSFDFSICAIGTGRSQPEVLEAGCFTGNNRPHIRARYLARSRLFAQPIA